MIATKSKTVSGVQVEVVEEPLIQKKGKKIGILGGTFNPPHIAHLLIAEQVGSQLGLDKVLFIPDFIPPHVDEKKTIPAEHRVEMIRLAIQDNPLFDLDLIEINRGGSSYSYDTVKELKQLHPENDYYFIIGGDMADYLPTWHRIDELVKMVQFVGVDRPKYQRQEQYPIIWVDVPKMDISSTKIRKNVKNGCSIRYQVPESVEKYIKEHRLYEQ
ncbi:nicotinate-nucleotide adenylyltransferase [Pediococcus pentosaceus]|uniref:nicotinate-nucleotide adenylyltransferase n=1 Tax=Pediococcus pentosaceus TaxID=1255 RepID=UPI0018FE9C59|nr:nicotinate-nucleotide adenylyltransferase [Pediococcus pentosaceus]